MQIEKEPSSYNWTPKRYFTPWRRVSDRTLSRSIGHRWGNIRCFELEMLENGWILSLDEQRQLIASGNQLIPPINKTKWTAINLKLFHIVTVQRITKRFQCIIHLKKTSYWLWRNFCVKLNKKIELNFCGKIMSFRKQRKSISHPIFVKFIVSLLNELCLRCTFDCIAISDRVWHRSLCAQPFSRISTFSLSITIYANRDLEYHEQWAHTLSLNCYSLYLSLFRFRYTNR